MIDLFDDVRKGEGETVSALLEAGIDPNTRDEKGFALLHNAVFYGHSSIASKLIEAGADVNARVQEVPSAPDSKHLTWKNWSVLHWAVEGGDIDCVQVLLDARANLFLTDKDGLSAVDLAADEDHDPDIACLLIRARWLERRKDYP